MKLDKSIVQRRIDLMAAEGVVRRPIGLGYFYLLTITEDLCSECKRGRKHRRQSHEGRVRCRRNCHGCHMAQRFENSQPQC